MDVIEIAKQRRGILAKEVAKLDEFIRMGEELSKSSRSPEPQREAAASAGNGGGANTIRQFSAENAAATKS